MSVSDDALVPSIVANVNFSPYSFLDTYCRHETDFTGLVVDCTFTIYVLTRDFLATRWRLLIKKETQKATFRDRSWEKATFGDSLATFGDSLETFGDYRGQRLIFVLKKATSGDIRRIKKGTPIFE